jgi:hypothetical protein
MMQKVGAIESDINEEQRKLILATEKYFEKLFVKKGPWDAGVTC